MPSIDVIYARNLKPGDLYAGDVDRDAPTRPVQPFAWAHEVRKVSLYTDGQGKDMVLIAGPNGRSLPGPGHHPGHGHPPVTPCRVTAEPSQEQP